MEIQQWVIVEIKIFRTVANNTQDDKLLRAPDEYIIERSYK
jgi:hypothetical protein